MATPGIAAQAYSQIARIASDPSKAAGGKAGGGGIAGISDKSFGDMLKNAIGSVVETGRKSDAQVQSVAAGKANVVDVVSAVAETEVAVDALVAVRDKVIQAYEEIMRMPI
jgi:flagellar hook-basal body complex protein FliE